MNFIKKYKPLIISLIWFFGIRLAYWYNGIDLLKRGPGRGEAIVVPLICATLIYAFCKSWEYLIGETDDR